MFGKVFPKIAEVVSWDDLADKPFEVEVTDEIVFEETQLTGEEYQYGLDCYYTDLFPNFKPEVGVEYTVYFDGVAYECVGRYSSGFQLGASFGGPYTEYPFCLSNDAGSSSVNWSLDAGTTHTIKIVQRQTNVRTLDPQYLPKIMPIEDLTDAPTADDFNNLLAYLREAGYLAE